MILTVSLGGYAIPSVHVFVNSEARLVAGQVTGQVRGVNLATASKLQRLLLAIYRLLICMERTGGQDAPLKRNGCSKDGNYCQ